MCSLRELLRSVRTWAREIVCARRPVFKGGAGTPGYTAAVDVEKVLLASPRGYCAGVERAVETVEKALELYGTPVYVRKQIVHNIHVVRDLEQRGAIFVDEETEVPEGSTLVFSAHGVAPSVRENSVARQLTTIDATCPLVTKVHVQARRYASEGYTIILIGHDGHEEVVGTLGEAPDSIVLVEGRRYSTESTAALRLTRYMDGAWPALGAFLFVPAFLRDFCYEILARNRYRWFGRLDACRVPTPEIRQRFLE